MIPFLLRFVISGAPAMVLPTVFVSMLIGCGVQDSNKPSMQTAPQAPGAHTRGQMRYLALGDSYTIGEGIPADDRWPMRLAELLRRKNVAIQPPTIIAVTGYTTADLINKLDHEPVASSFDLVSLMIGVNDQYQGLPEDVFRRGFDELFRRSIAYAGGKPGHVLVLSIPDWSKSPFGQRNGPGEEISRAIDRLNAIAQERCIASGAHWIDVTDLTRKAAGNPKMFAPDGLHYSRTMHEQWAALALPAEASSK